MTYTCQAVWTVVSVPPGVLNKAASHATIRTGNPPRTYARQA